MGFKGSLGGSWVVISRVVSRVTIVISHISGLITPLITPHEPPSKSSTSLGFRVFSRVLALGAYVSKFSLFRALRL